MIDVVYLLVGESGQWEDYHKWVVRAYLNDAAARRAAKIAEREAAEAMKANARDEPWEAIRNSLTVDPEAEIYEPSHYYVTAVDVAQGIEAGTGETPWEARSEGRKPGGEAMRPDDV